MLYINSCQLVSKWIL